MNPFSALSNPSAIEPKGDLACPIGFIPEEAFIISNPLIKFFLFFGSSAISSILFGTSLAILMKDLPILLVKALKEELSIFINFSFSFSGSGKLFVNLILRASFSFFNSGTKSANLAFLLSSCSKVVPVITSNASPNSGSILNIPLLSSPTINCSSENSSVAGNSSAVSTFTSLTSSLTSSSLVIVPIAFSKSLNDKAPSGGASF